MDTVKTRAQLVVMALEELGAIATGQAPEEEDVAKVDGRFDGLMAELATRSIFYLPAEDEIPVETSGALAELLANECAPQFGKGKMDESGKRMIESRLLKMVASKTTNEPLRTVYY